MIEHTETFAEACEDILHPGRRESRETTLQIMEAVKIALHQSMDNKRIEVAQESGLKDLTRQLLFDRIGIMHSSAKHWYSGSE